MKTIGLILGLVCTSLVVTAQSQQGVMVTVTIENVLNDTGTVMTSLHTADTFMKGGGIVNLEKAATPGEITFTFENVVPGSYAVMVLHDENDNKRMDFETNGMPKENYGTTGEMEAMGPPSFYNSKFEVADQNVDLKIRF